MLAESYYENGDYGKCISALASYEALGTRIFRKDYEFARVLPLAVISAGHTLSGNDYVEAVERYLTLILNNTDYDDWVSHYFAAQTYIDLYARTGDSSHLKNAYELAVNNVNCLVNEQRELNAVYLAPVVEAEEPKGAMCHYLIFEQNADNCLDNRYIIREGVKDYYSPLECFSVVTDTF